MNRRKFFPALIGLPLAVKAIPKMIQRNGKECPCDVCGKEQHDFKKEYTTIGIQISSVTNGIKDAHLQHLFGQYKLDKNYNICWECWLKSLGVKP